MAQKKTIAPPRGTRDLYPEDVLRRRYITQAWRDVSIRHGFDEIEGPTFEQSELYAVKSGEGILGELFQAFSGKSPEEIEEVKRTGRAPFALRPEFTPTLARMYAAKAASLPTPTKWFTAGPYFRAERPQRGRLREFLQWNCDIMGLDVSQERQNAEGAEGSAEVAEAKARFDAELAACMASLLELLGLRPDMVQLRLSDRAAIVSLLIGAGGISSDATEQALTLLDRRGKLPAEVIKEQAGAIDLDLDAFDREIALGRDNAASSLLLLRKQLDRWALRDWCVIDPAVVRGLAYYTGMVFEVIADGERAVAGGGRYDDLISLFGGPPTPAVGFGMGDVVLSLLLEDKGLMPEGEALMDAVSRPPASVRPDAFVIAEDEALDPVVTRTVARLRAGIESDAWRDRGGKPWDADRYAVPPMHARRSYKATRKRDKLVKDAMKAGARNVVVVESEEACTVRDLGTGKERGVGLEELGAAIERREAP
jgi:histidyl-tRNA synthetase